VRWALLAAIGPCLIVLCCSQTAEATLPTDTAAFRHFDLDPVGSGFILGSGASISQFFDDALNSPGYWTIEYRLGNPADFDTDPLEFDLRIVWPTHSFDTSVVLPGGAVLGWSESYYEVPETLQDYHFTFNNSLSQLLLVDASVTELEIPGTPPIDDFRIELLDGSPAPPDYGVVVTPGPVPGDFVLLSIAVPEPSSLLLALYGGFSALLFGRRATFTSRVWARRP